MIDYDKPILNRNGKPLFIGLLASHHCIRVIKRATALKKMGYTIWGNGDRVSYGTSLYDNYLVWHNKEQFKNNVKLMIDSGVDIVDWSNEPDHPVKWIREVITSMNVQDRVKLVTDLHDLDSIRRGIIPKPEREMFMLSDGLIYVSKPIQEKSNYLHHVTVPNTVLYSYCNDGIVEYEEDKVSERHGLVYQGGVNPAEDKELNQVFAYRDLHSIFKRLVELGNETHVYVGNANAYNSLQTTGAVVHPPTIYDKMMKELTQYKYGVLIFNNEDGKKDQVNYTLSNKEEEFLQAGLPSLACWCPESMKHVKKHGIGFIFEHIDEIQDCSNLEDKYREVMNNIKIKRKELVMENFIHRIENLYSEVLGVDKKGIPDDIRKFNDFEYNKD